MAHTTENNAPATDICKDKELRAIRQKTFAKLKWSPVLNSASRLMGMFGGPLFGTGLLALIGFGGTSVIATTAIIMASVGAALSIMSIAADYISTRIAQDGYLDQTDVGARSNARYLVQELKANNMCLVQEHEQNCRTDGKKWAHTVQTDMQPEPQRH